MNKGKQIKPHLVAKRNEYIWSLVAQKYSYAEIADIFNLSKSRIHVIANNMPAGWKSPWIKMN